eukprot:11589493-Ditylum_brightwellii.AAC.1
MDTEDLWAPSSSRNPLETAPPDEQESLIPQREQNQPSIEVEYNIPDHYGSASTSNRKNTSNYLSAATTAEEASNSPPQVEIPPTLQISLTEKDPASSDIKNTTLDPTLIAIMEQNHTQMNQMMTLFNTTLQAMQHNQ